MPSPPAQVSQFQIRGPARVKTVYKLPIQEPTNLVQEPASLGANPANPVNLWTPSESEWAPPDYVRESIKKFPFQIKGDHQNIEGGSI